MKKQGASRRTFLASSAPAWLAASWPGIMAAQQHAHRAAGSGKPAKLEFFSQEQATEIESVAAQIIPTDDTPGAREARIVYFIDRALMTFDKGRQPVYTQGLKDLQARTRELSPGANKFSDLSSAQQIKLLAAMERTDFFAQVRLHTIVGFFANPAYGGNYDKSGWKLIGFDDKFAFEPPFGSYDRNYKGGA